MVSPASTMGEEAAAQTGAVQNELENLPFPRCELGGPYHESVCCHDAGELVGPAGWEMKSHAWAFSSSGRFQPGQTSL